MGAGHFGLVKTKPTCIALPNQRTPLANGVSKNEFPARPKQIAAPPTPGFNAQGTRIAGSEAPKWAAGLEDFLPISLFRELTCRTLLFCGTREQ
jgi:hypothetical protein